MMVRGSERGRGEMHNVIHVTFESGNFDEQRV